MRHLLPIFLTASVAFAAPGLKDKGPLYYPTRIGDAFVYEVNDDGKKSELTVIVVGVEEKDGGWIVSTAAEPKGRVSSKVRVSEKELLQVSYGSRDFDAPNTLLRLPAKAGESWEVKPIGRIPGYKCKVAGEEELTLPAGKFKAIRVDSELTIDGTAVKLTFWYAPGRGLVKKASVTGGLEWSQTLKSFSPGK